MKGGPAGWLLGAQGHAQSMRVSVHVRPTDGRTERMRVSVHRPPGTGSSTTHGKPLRVITAVGNLTVPK